MYGAKWLSFLMITAHNLVLESRPCPAVLSFLIYFLLLILCMKLRASISCHFAAATPEFSHHGAKKDISILSYSVLFFCRFILFILKRARLTAVHSNAVKNRMKLLFFIFLGFQNPSFGEHVELRHAGSSFQNLSVKFGDANPANG